MSDKMQRICVCVALVLLALILVTSAMIERRIRTVISWRQDGIPVVVVNKQSVPVEVRNECVQVDIGKNNTVLVNNDRLPVEILPPAKPAAADASKVAPTPPAAAKTTKPTAPSAAASETGLKGSDSKVKMGFTPPETPKQTEPELVQSLVFMGKGQSLTPVYNFDWKWEAEDLIKLEDGQIRKDGMVAAKAEVQFTNMSPTGPNRVRVYKLPPPAPKTP